MDADIKDMYERYRDDDPEIFTELSNTITMNEGMKTALAKNERALKKAYFGRIDVKDGDRDVETFYIGKGGVMNGTTEILVVDWRAPIANVYYENGLGECSYQAPEQQRITIDLRRKRTYEIDGEKLLDYFDSEVVANDELLTKYLAKNKEAVLGEIIATIQKEQNDIIRKTPYRNMIVQGVAGSGKTTVAMHRISFILYNYVKDFRPEDFYIIGSNRILLNYITGVLPELDVHGVKQMTMEQLFIRLLYEEWNEKKIRVVPCKTETVCKGTQGWFEKLREYCNRLEDSLISEETIYLEDEVLFSAEQIQNYRRANPTVSLQGKIDGLNERVLIKLKNEMTGRELAYPAEERKRLMKEYTGRFGAKKWKRPMTELYAEFLQWLSEDCEREAGRLETEGTLAQFGSERVQNAIRMTQEAITPAKKNQPGNYDVYDLAALAYLYKRIKETDPIREAHHIVIDEAQDFGMMAYQVLHYCIPGCGWTIMGDVSQNIHFGFGLNDWEELKTLVLKDEKDTFGVLSKSYRNTVEISEFAQQILRHGSFSSYPIEPIIRHGNPVCVERCAAVLERAVEKLTQWQQEGHETIAVVLRNEAEAAMVAAELKKRIEIGESDLEKAEFGKGILVLPVEYTKGLEFDAVLIYEPTPEDYPEDDGHAKLLYVAATRALHELAVLYTDEVTKLIG
ncbi:MAG: AAA family ATPase [Lachnospiraceae bacterium]|nr:AAA family ATPase [Lachnospiraceae bacterium]